MRVLAREAKQFYAELLAVIRSGSAPPRSSHTTRAVTSLRNLAVGVLRLTGHPNLAAALRHISRDPARPLAILGLADRRNRHHATLTEP